jgi:putative ABC transport system permease protein
VRALDRKLLRDVWTQRGPALAIAAVIGSGIALFVLMTSCLHSLQLTRDTYYDRYRFADVFVSLVRAPNRLIEEIRSIPQVARARDRVVVDVTLDVPGWTDPASGRLISMPPDDAPVLCDIFLRRGRYLEPGRRDEAIVSEGFAAAHGLDPGDTLRAVINGRLRELRIVGIALSPEYVYSIRPGELLPDDERFAVIWMHRRALASAFDMEGGFNDVVLRLSPGADEQDVIARLDDLLARYGGKGAIPRRHQMSHWYLQSELDGLRSFGTLLPIVFLAVAAFLLNVVMTRMVSVQRPQIASLKAIGYSNLSLAWHYVQWSLTVTAIGTAAGIAVGAWMGSGMTRLYTDFFDFPILRYQLPWAVLVQAAAVSVAAAVLGSLFAVRRAVTLPPAVAMRPEPPTRFDPSIVEQLGAGPLISPPARIVLRTLERHPGRALVSVLGIAAAAGLLIGGSFSFDAMDRIIDVQFRFAQRYDVMLTFERPASPRAIHEVSRLPGVLHAEGFRSVAARLEHEHRRRHAAITGIDPEARLNRIVDVDRDRVVPPPEGLVISRKLADVLGARVGDVLTIDVREGDRPTLRVPLVGLVEDTLGTNAYMGREALHRLMQEADILSGAYLLIDDARREELFRRLKRVPRVAGVMHQDAAIEAFERTMGETVAIARGINVLFAVIIAFGVVYNAARISLAERARELATLRVIGFRRGEIAQILLGELGLITLVAIPLGLLAGRLMAVGVVEAYDTELFRMPLYIAPATYATAVVTILAASLLSGLVMRRKLNRLDLIEVLKTRE